jgi:hypothetical protein
MRLRRLAGACLACSLLVGACVAPAFTAEDYRSKVADTAEGAASALESVRLAVESADRHDLPSNPIDIAIADQEDILGSIAGTFAGIQPPTAGSIELRDRIQGLLEDGQGFVADARIAFRRGDLRGALDAVDSAEKVAAELDSIATALG